MDNRLHYIVKVGELALKGGNKAYFERKLKDNIKRKLKNFDCSLSGNKGRYYVSTSDCNRERVENSLSSIFGIVGFAEVCKTVKNMDAIRRTACTMVETFLSQGKGTRFKIEARRSDKGFPLDSYQIASDVGQFLRDSFSSLSVDVHNPDWILYIEIREKAVLYGPPRKGPGGLPVGTAGKGVLLLSGGIDSPVAGYLMAKRGLQLNSVYFHTYPYTSDEVLTKVETLAKTLSLFLGVTTLYIVPFTKIQVEIKQKKYEEEVTLLTRACMMRIAALIADKTQGLCLITGESLSQVASQTPESLRFTQSTSHLPVFRPLIGMDKEEIITIARSINTYDTSILPYDDCCTLFSPKHPLIRPDFLAMEKSYTMLNIEGTLREAVEAAEKRKYPDRPAD